MAIEAARALAAESIRARVVSMPCREWFDAQPASYRELSSRRRYAAGLSSRPG
ncbi:hypothetical protein GTW64_33430 [Streptomyces sp. SID4923]|nr:hypothetical protein [Streptomyces sp. SID4923]